MRHLSEWFQGGHLAVNESVSLKQFQPKEFLKTFWVVLVMALLGVCALITAILVAWPVLAHLASKLFV